MRVRISTKLFMILLFTIALFAVLMYLFSALFLENFYIRSKEKQLYKCLDSVKQIIAGEEAEYQNALEALQFQKGINITITDSSFNDVFSTMPFRAREEDQNPPKIPIKNPRSEKLFADNLSKFTQNGTMVRRPNGWTQMESLNLFASLKSNAGETYYAVFSTSFEAIKNSMEAAASFIQLVAVIVFVIGVFLIYYVSRKATGPLVKINEVAGKMALMEFSHTIENNSNDEIGDIGRSINTLSTELNKTLGELSSTNEQLRKELAVREKIDASRKQFISDVSHELKTPIALIGGFAEGLKLNINNDDKEYYCEVIMDETRKMSALVLSLLDLSQIEGGYADMSREVYSATEQLQNILKRYKIVFEEKGITLAFDRTKDCCINADPVRVEQVVTNFINNAIDHVDERKQLAIELSMNKGKCKVSIFNSGKNIPPEQIERIWDNFYKLDKARSREFGGTGLGLAIAKAIVHAHGGRCSAENLANGVSFWFEI